MDNFKNSKILKTVIDNYSKNLSDTDKILRENSRRITEMLTLEKVSPNVLNLLIQIKKSNSSIIVTNAIFKAVEVIVDEDDCN
jgi:hypothetical protein